MKAKKFYCLTHFDLDGLTSYLVLKWSFPKAHITYDVTSIQNFRDKFTDWMASHNIDDYDKIFIMDYDVSEHRDLVDRKNVIIIDHHTSHDKGYKNATPIVKEYSSAAMLAYKFFKKLYNIELTDAQKKLILLADDYDCYKLQFPDSRKLNTVLYETNNSVESYIKNFSRGFHGFTVEQQNMIKIYDMNLKKTIKDLTLYKNTVKIQNNDALVYATFADGFINEVAESLLDKHKADVAIVVNPKYNHVSYRTNNDKIDVSVLACKLGEDKECGGHAYAAGSRVTDKFMTFTKLLKEV